MLAMKEHLQSAAVKEELGLLGLELDVDAVTSIRSNCKNKRFNDEQIKSLEVMFESDSRPESVIKQQLANELGLQPRQIGIWFQNRRARTKAKQIKRDYSVLKQSYDALSSSYESLKRENQSLRIHLQKLKSRLELEHGNRRLVLDMIEDADGSLTYSEKWCSFESKCFLNESSCSSNWWEYW